MGKKKDSFTSEQIRLIDGLENHPVLLKRFLSILDLASEPDENGNIRSADEIESELIGHTRKLGKETLESWGTRVEEKISKKKKSSSTSMQQREKKL